MELLFIRPAKQKKNRIYHKFYQNMLKVFFIFKMEHHNFWSKYQNGNSQL